jgi:hypothetical protein
MSETFPEEEFRFTDPLDAASHIADLHNRRSEAVVRAKAAPEQVRKPDGTWPTETCIDCDEELNAVRLMMGRVRCIACQTHKEKLEARRGLGRS